MGAAYFTIDSSAGEGYFDVSKLDKLTAVYESDGLRIVEFQTPLIIGIDGKKGRGVVVYPPAESTIN